MNKLLITLFLLGTCFSMNTIAEPYMSDSSKQKYLDFLKKSSVYDDTTYVVLAMASDGCWSTGWGRLKPNAKKMGIKNCKKLCKSSCEIYDINGRSDFIKKGNSYTSSSTSTTSSSSSTSATGSSTVFMSDQDKTKYLNWVKKLSQGDADGKCWGGECRAALAVGPNGCWAKFPDMSLSRSKKQALMKCNADCGTNDCQIMDIDGKSAFIKQKGSSASSSTSSSSSSSSSTITTASTATDPAIELEFWKSIKDSDDPDMFQAYLDEYPNGKFVPLAKLKIKKLRSSTTRIEATSGILTSAVCNSNINYGTTYEKGNCIKSNGEGLGSTSKKTCDQFGHYWQPCSD